METENTQGDNKEKKEGGKMLMAIGRQFYGDSFERFMKIGEVKEFIASFKDFSPAKIITCLSKPKAIPPCGGVPNSNASSI